MAVTSEVGSWVIVGGRLSNPPVWQDESVTQSNNNNPKQIWRGITIIAPYN